MIRTTALAALLGLSACGQPYDDSTTRKSIADLETRVTALEQAKAAQAAIPPAPITVAELVVTDGPRSYRRAYDSSEKCEAAREAVEAGNARREAAAQAQVGTVNAAGVRIVAVGSPRKAEAVCIPT